MSGAVASGARAGGRPAGTSAAAARLLGPLLLSGALGLAPSLAAAQDDHGQHPQAQGAHDHDEVTLHDVAGLEDAQGNLKSFFWGSVLNFLILLFIFFHFGRGPVTAFLSGRKRAIEEGLAEAQRLKAQAQAKYDEYASRLERLDREIAGIRAEMTKAGEAERDRIVADAESKAARMRRDASFLIDQQLKQLRVDLTREAVESAVAAAESVLRESTSATDQTKLADAYLARIRAEAEEGSERRGAARPGGSA